jgi:hypothetical protein
MLNQLREIAAPHPPHILQRMMPLVPRYGDLSADANFAQLVEDACRLIELNPVPWEGVRLDRSDIAARCRQRSLVAVFFAVYDAYAEARGTRDWCCKSLANIEYLVDIENYAPNARYIYLYRDGRDVAVSFRKAVVGEKHFYHVAKEWADTQELAIQHRNRINPSRFFSLSYEALTSEPEATVRRLCQFLGVEFTEAMLEFHKSEDAAKASASSELWRNVASPVMRNNSRKFLKEASIDEVRIFEAVAGHVLDTLGYERTYLPKGRTIPFSSSELERFNKENQELKQQVLKSVDPDDLARRTMQEELLAQIKARRRGVIANR